MSPALVKTKKRTYRRELRQKQAAATRASIVEAFGALLAEPGRGDVTMTDVARAASVAPATLFRHFENRQVLYDAYMGHGAAQFRLAPNIADSIDPVASEVSPDVDPDVEVVAAIVVAVVVVAAVVSGEWQRQREASKGGHRR